MPDSSVATTCSRFHFPKRIVYRRLCILTTIVGCAAVSLGNPEGKWCLILAPVFAYIGGDWRLSQRVSAAVRALWSLDADGAERRRRPSRQIEDDPARGKAA